MPHSVTTHSHQGITALDRRHMYQLRYETFHERLGWDVHTADGMEFDGFDDVEQVHYILAKGVDGQVDACWRLLPTQGPYMLKDVFPDLLQGLPAPQAADVWELSRFALATARLPRGEDAGNPQIGFGQLSAELIREAGRFAVAHGISRYVTVTTAAIERMLKHSGLNIHRLARPQKIGNVLTVACFIEVDGAGLEIFGVK